MNAPRGPGRISRRLPPLVMGGVALALMVALLPSSLHLPITGPGSQAEVAPVPGQGNSQANLSALGLADSGTVGSGGAGANADGSMPSPPVGSLLKALGANGLGTVAQQSKCVGNPPRQTEDPLSPPCVPFWQGNNGGVTGKGVTGNSITVMLVDSRYGHDGFDYLGPPTANDSPVDTTTRLLLRYFQSRFQTYGRTVHLYMDRGPGQGTAGNPQSFQTTDERHRPFGVITHDTAGESSYPTKAVKSGTMVFAGTYRPGSSACDPATLARNAPFQWCFGTTLDSLRAAYAKYVCSGLVGKPARLAGDTTYQVATRHFGIQAVDNQLDGATKVQAAISATCGVNPTIYPYSDDSTGRTAVVAKLKGDGVTTVLNATDNLMPDAPKQAYSPEWVVMGGSLAGGFNQQAGRNTAVPATEWNQLFGISERWRWRPPPQPYWYEAVQEVDSSAIPDDYLGSSIYYGLLMAFTAIQMSGPNLNPANVEHSMSHFTAFYDPPFSPRGGYAPGDYSFLHDFMIEKYDTSGTPPGGSAGSGCFRLADGGKRYQSTEAWPTGDRAAAIGASDPCQADEIGRAPVNADSDNL